MAANGQILFVGDVRHLEHLGLFHCFGYWLARAPATLGDALAQEPDQARAIRAGTRSTALQIHRSSEASCGSLPAGRRQMFALSAVGST